MGTSEPAKGSFPDPATKATGGDERLGPGIEREDITLSFDVGKAAAEVDEFLGLLEDSTKNRYEVLEKIGAGQIGEVFRAKDRRLGRVIALKRIRGARQDAEEFLRGFVHQTRAIANLNHYNIVQVYDVGRDEQGHYIAMEYVAGRTLGAFMEESGPQPLLYAVELGRQLCNALEVAHGQKVIHGDIKPANVLLTESGVPKLVDFGLALLNRNGKSSGGAGGDGSPFVAPEQLKGAERIDVRADIYSLAAMLYQVLTGKVPRPPHPTELPAPIRPVLLKCLDEDPERRYASVSELGDALHNIALATPEPEPEPAAAIQPELVKCPQCNREIRGDVEFCGACGFELRRAQQVTELLQRARRYLQQNAKEQALRQYEAVLEINPQQPEAVNTAASIRQTIERIAELRKQANELTVVGALRKAINVWRELLKYAPSDQEAQTQIEKCEEQLQARQIVMLLTGARVEMRQHKFETAEEKCRRVLSSDPQNAEATALLWLIPQARQRWLEGLITSAVDAYRSQDFETAYNRFSEIYATGAQWLSEEEIQQLNEGMEMARLVPALRELHGLVNERPLEDTIAELDRRAERATCERAKQLIARSRAAINERYQRMQAEEQRRAAEAAAAEAAKRRRQRRIMFVAILATAAAIIGPYLIVRHVNFKRLPANARAAFDNRDYDTALRSVERYRQGGGPHADVETLQRQLTEELRRRLDRHETADVQRWAAVLGALAGKRSIKEYVFGLVLENHAAALESERWPAVCTALCEMAEYDPATTAEASDVPQQLETTLARLEELHETRAGRPEWSATLEGIEQTLETDQLLRKFVTREMNTRLWTLQLDAALAERALQRARVYAAKLDRLDLDAFMGSARIRVYGDNIPQRVEQAAQAGDYAAARGELRAGVELRGEDAPEISEKWRWLLDHALQRRQWNAAKDVAADMDQLYEDKPGTARLAELRRELFQQARAAAGGGKYDELQDRLSGVLCLPGPADDVVRLVRTAVGRVSDSDSWDQAAAAVDALEELGRGRGVGMAGFEELLDKAVKMQDVERAKRAVGKLDRLLPAHGQELLSHKLQYDVLNRARRAFISADLDAQQRALGLLIDSAPLLVWNDATWAEFCRQPDALIAEALQDAYCAARAIGDEPTMERIRQLNEGLKLMLDCPP